MKKADGSLVQDQTELNDILVQAFQILFSLELTTEWDTKWEEAKIFIEMKISPAQQHALEEDLSEKEIIASLKEMPRGKGPGTDGFPAEFFIKTWHFIGGLFMKVVRNMWQVGNMMGRLFNGSLITLLPKGGDLLLVNQWRPISLLPTLYKAVAKALSRQLRASMDQTLEDEQQGFTKGRSIVDNLLLFTEAKWWAYHHHLPTVVLLLDFSKAYNRVEWKYM